MSTASNISTLPLLTKQHSRPHRQNWSHCLRHRRAMDMGSHPPPKFQRRMELRSQWSLLVRLWSYDSSSSLWCSCNQSQGSCSLGSHHVRNRPRCKSTNVPRTINDAFCLFTISVDTDFIILTQTYSVGAKRLILPSSSSRFWPTSSLPPCFCSVVPLPSKL
jgi:hypothetical protein